MKEESTRAIETTNTVDVESVIAKFEIGKVYPLHDICYTVIKRTDKFVTFKHQTAMSAVLGYYKEETTKKAIKHDDKGNEVVYGLGVFGHLDAAIDLETYEHKFNCKLVEGVFINYNWNAESTIDVELVDVEDDDELVAIIDEYAVNVEAQEIAIEAEIELKLRLKLRQKLNPSTRQFAVKCISLRTANSTLKIVKMKWLSSIKISTNC